MSVYVRPYYRRKDGKQTEEQIGWEVDIITRHPDGRELRERRKAPVSTKSGAKRWGQERERQLLAQPTAARQQRERRRAKKARSVPTLAAFEDRFIEGYAEANRHKRSGISSKRSAFKNHLVPALGKKRLDRITNEDVQRIKADMIKLSPKTVNNILSTLNVTLKTAVRWGVIETMPCTIELLKVTSSPVEFYDFDEYDVLVDAAAKVDHRALVVVRLGGEAGLRRGEMKGLEWTDLDFNRGLITVQRSVWKGTVGLPKGGRPRTLPMTDTLKRALLDHRHLRGPRVLYQETGEPATAKTIQRLMMRVQRRANMPGTGGVHILRHTFCSHMAMLGVPARTIQELAGHKDLSTTQRYMHLSPAAIRGGIELLEKGRQRQRGGEVLGEIQETGTPN